MEAIEDMVAPVICHCGQLTGHAEMYIMCFKPVIRFELRGKFRMLPHSDMPEIPHCGKCGIAVAIASAWRAKKKAAPLPKE